MAEWAVEFFVEDALQALQRAFEEGLRCDVGGRRLLNEVRVGDVGPLRIQIFAREHPPPHFRAWYQGETADYRISDCAQLNGGLRQFYRKVRNWHNQNKQLLIATWNSNRPTDCPVGIYRE